jgi:hypothetical protein
MKFFRSVSEKSTLEVMLQSSKRLGIFRLNFPLHGLRISIFDISVSVNARRIHVSVERATDVGNPLETTRAAAEWVFAKIIYFFIKTALRFCLTTQNYLSLKVTEYS